MKAAKKRCAWAGMSDPLYLEYHDEEWGVPSHDDRHLFEMLILEGAQAGLSWSTILHKRAAYRKAYDGFDPERVARYLKVQEEFGSFAKFAWGFVGGAPIVNARRSLKDVPARTAESDAFSKELKRRGFKFVGTTIMYAFMQAVGMVNDHAVDCFRYRAGSRPATRRSRAGSRARR